jgi:hypothetical protein
MFTKATYSIIILFTYAATAQEMKIITSDKSVVLVEIVSDSVKQSQIQTFNGQTDDRFRKSFTSRTYKLSNGQLLVEFYDKQAVVINNADDFKKLEEVIFVKNYIEFLKRDISYKIPLSTEKAKEISKKGKRLTQYQSTLPQYFDFEVYQLENEQILFVDKSEHTQASFIYKDIKTLAGEKQDVLEQHYGDVDKWSEKFVYGDRLPDYTGTLYIWPKDLNNVLKNHKLQLIETEIYVSHFHSNLYKSDNGYYVLIDEVNQKNGAGDELLILDVYIFDSLESIEKAKAEYINFKSFGTKGEHFYQNISDRFGKNFSQYVNELIKQLPEKLNINSEITFDREGIDIVSEAVKWNHGSDKDFKNWYPSVFAFYGECFINNRKEGKWISMYDEEDKVWVPKVLLDDGSEAFDVFYFSKSLYEWPVTLTSAGQNWEGNWGKK